jgi:hypothetical protein
VRECVCVCTHTHTHTHIYIYIYIYIYTHTHTHNDIKIDVSKQSLQNYIYIVVPMGLFVSCAGDLTTVGGTLVVVTPVRSPPWSLLFLFTWPWAIECFSCPDVSLAFCPSGVLERWCWWQDAESGTLAIRTHTRLELKCIAGFGLF